MTHTPGPWTFTKWRTLTSGQRMRERFVRDREGEVIAYCDLAIDQAQVNAVLIAAAPDMLAALQFYANPENWKEQETGIGMYPGEAVDYGQRARQALAKMKEARL